MMMCVMNDDITDAKVMLISASVVYPAAPGVGGVEAGH